MISHLKYLAASLLATSSLTFGSAYGVTKSDSHDDFIIVADKITDDYYPVGVANGILGVVPGREPFKINEVVLNHVFDTKHNHDVNTILTGLNPFNLDVVIDGKKLDETGYTDLRQKLDMKKGVHTTDFRVKGKAEIESSIRALRGLPYTVMTEVTVKALANMHLQITNPITVPDGYVDIEEAFAINDIKGRKFRIRRKSAASEGSKMIVSASSLFFTDSGNPMDTLTANLRKGETFRFYAIGSVVTANDFVDPWNESDRQVIYAACEQPDRLIQAHEKAWEELWKGDVIIEGDQEAQQAIRLSLYHLYSSAREGTALSIPPFGLNHTQYKGHIFWDSEFWMYPPMLMLNQGIAKSMIDYRTDRLKSAQNRAAAYGYQGAMFPWESDYAGEESCPTWALSGPFEHHITADIAIAAWNYYRMTRDLEWLRSKGYPLMAETSNFWVSRAEPNDDGSYSIRDVVCADEYAEGVDDNSFTNAAVSQSLRFATEAAHILGVYPDPQWMVLAENLRIPRLDSGVTAEYEGYDGRMVKQADVNLMAYPLGYTTSQDQIRRDLEYYYDKIDPNGPAMSYAVLAVAYARLGDGDKAYELFHEAFAPHQKAPFNVITEYANGGAAYFCTGAGGFLQAVINGFCGLELTDDGVKQVDSALPSHWKSVTVKGVGPDRQTFTR